MLAPYSQGEEPEETPGKQIKRPKRCGDAQSNAPSHARPQKEELGRISDPFNKTPLPQPGCFTATLLGMWTVFPRAQRVLLSPIFLSAGTRELEASKQQQRRGQLNIVSNPSSGRYQRSRRFRMLCNDGRREEHSHISRNSQVSRPRLINARPPVSVRDGYTRVIYIEFTPSPRHGWPRQQIRTFGKPRFLSRSVGKTGKSNGAGKPSQGSTPTDRSALADSCRAGFDHAAENFSKPSMPPISPPVLGAQRRPTFLPRESAEGRAAAVRWSCARLNSLAVYILRYHIYSGCHYLQCQRSLDHQPWGISAVLSIRRLLPTQDDAAVWLPNGIPTVFSHPNQQCNDTTAAGHLSLWVGAGSGSTRTIGAADRDNRPYEGSDRPCTVMRARDEKIGGSGKIPIHPWTSTHGARTGHHMQ
ncbi:hypothetical protein QBC40DRAFT_302136 [Triangularia verruculosa]|uniref:Uncharacterized protein n=1 Tax=Triangularia verruculosa TaxID=2587418 RepID=A0AAN6X990_9PEZI|nr:hypothetical protein QBC40DRAFT_302136 [Triangularia verruculosa]